MKEVIDMSGPKTYSVDISDGFDSQYIRQKLIEQTQSVIDSSLSIIEEIKEKIYNELNRTPSECKVKTVITQPVRGNVSKIFLGSDAELPMTENVETIENENNNIEEYNMAIENYVKACCILNKSPDDCFNITAENIDEVISALNVETERMMKKAIEISIKQEIYSKSLEALKEMGYEVIGEKKNISANGNSINSTLVKINENIGVNMVCIDGSKFTYEVVGLAEDDHTATETEEEDIMSAMVEMCHTDFTLYLKKLSDKGLVVKDLVDRLAEKRFCKNKNISEYSSDIFNSDDGEELSCQKSENSEGITV